MKRETELKTDFKALAAMTDGDIDCSDIPALMEEELNSDRWFSETPEDWYGITRPCAYEVELAVQKGKDRLEHAAQSWARVDKMMGTQAV